MKRKCRYILMLPFLFCWIPFAGAQSGDFNIGFGTNHVKSNGLGIDNANSPVNAFGTCLPGTGDPYCEANPGLDGFFMGFGGDIMLKKHYGFGAEITFLPAKGNYGPLQFRQTFYDFNGIYAPINEKRVVLKLMGGIGGSKTGFSLPESSCVGTAVCEYSNESIGSSSHFQIHVGVGVEVYVTEHIFVRPQFDFRYVPSFTDQFGSSTVTGGMLWVGFNTGGR